jgi:hypothetical protein
VARAIHFVGSIPLGTTENVFATLGRIVGPRAARYPDGETGGRERFIAWQVRVWRAPAGGSRPPRSTRVVSASPPSAA